MVALLRELRRERNGAVADSMRYYGTPYGLNYGVSLPTLRRIARAEAPDHGFARYLYRQDVRELRLAALHIACPACFTPEEFPAWAAGIVNSEIAEEAAFALLSRAEAFPALFSAWIASPDALLQYAALLAAARSPRLTASWVAPAVEAVHRNATAEATVETPAEATTEATAAAISAAADTSVAPGAFVFDTSVTEASSPQLPLPPQVSQPPQALLRPQTRMSPPRVLPGSRFPAGLRHSIPFPPPALRPRVRWRCSLPSRRKTKRTGRRYSAQPVLWVSSLPKTTSTRSLLGVWKHSFRLSALTHLLALFQFPEYVRQMVVADAAAFAPQHLAAAEKHQRRHRHDVVAVYDFEHVPVVYVHLVDIHAAVHLLLKPVYDGVHHLARPAPCCEEIHERQCVPPDNLVKIRCCHICRV